MKSISECTVLVVDDTETNIDILVEALGDDYDVSVAIDGNSALESINEELPDLILLDIMMPNMDGYTVCGVIKGDPRASDIPIIFLTALDSQENKEEGFALGAVDYITKPFDINEVKVRVQTHLTLRLSQQNLIEQYTQLQEALRQVEEAQQAQSTLASAMSQEFHIPLNAILGSVNLLHGQSLGPLNEKQLSYIDQIGDNGKHLLSLINDFLDKA
jgi:PleD family two-component response regulator